MIYLLLSILFSSLIFVLFRWIGLKKLDTFQVIVVNYLTASIFGYLVLSEHFSLTTLIRAPWFPAAISLGVAFIFVFYLMAVTTQKNGTSIAVIANKMSLVIPVIFAFWWYGDDISFLKISGIITAIAGVYLAVKKPSGQLQRHAWLPILLFFCSGGIDMGIKHAQHTTLYGPAAMLFVPTIFLAAFLMGSIVLAIKTGKSTVTWSSAVLLHGLLLGVVNFFSIYFLVRALEIKTLQSSVVFPLNNISIVLLSTFFGMTIFREKISSSNKIGILLSVIAILLISFSR